MQRNGRKNFIHGLGFALIIGYGTHLFAKLIETAILMYFAKSRSELSPDNVKDIVPWIAFEFCLLFTFFIKNVQYNYETSNLVIEKGFIFILSFIVAAIFCIILAADRNIVFSVNGPRTEISMEVIHTAAKESNLTLLKDEIRRGVNPNLKNSYGSTPLHFAAEVGFQEGVEFLLASGATVDAKGSRGWQGTALMAAAENNHYKVVETLLNAKANPNAKDDRGDTAIFFAARVSNLEIIKLLINHGAK